MNRDIPVKCELFDSVDDGSPNDPALLYQLSNTNSEIQSLGHIWSCVCSECHSYGYFTKLQRTNHVLDKHMQISRHMCSKCGISRAQSSTVAHHIRNSHQDEKDVTVIEQAIDESLVEKLVVAYFRNEEGQVLLDNKRSGGGRERRRTVVPQYFDNSVNQQLLSDSETTNKMDTRSLYTSLVSLRSSDAPPGTATTSRRSSREKSKTPAPDKAFLGKRERSKTPASQKQTQKKTRLNETLATEESVSLATEERVSPTYRLPKTKLSSTLKDKFYTDCKVCPGTSCGRSNKERREHCMKSHMGIDPWKCAKCDYKGVRHTTRVHAFKHHGNGQADAVVPVETDPEKVNQWIKECFLKEEYYSEYSSIVKEIEEAVSKSLKNAYTPISPHVEQLRLRRNPRNLAFHNTAEVVKTKPSTGKQMLSKRVSTSSGTSSTSRSPSVKTKIHSGPKTHSIFGESSLKTTGEVYKNGTSSSGPAPAEEIISPRSKFYCYLCDLELKIQPKWKTHIQCVHMQKPFVAACRFCDYKSAYLQNIKSHMIRKHNKFAEPRKIVIDKKTYEMWEANCSNKRTQLIPCDNNIEMETGDSSDDEGADLGGKPKSNKSSHIHKIDSQFEHGISKSKAVVRAFDTIVCNICRKCVWKKSGRIHVENTHIKRARYKCPDCGFSALNLGNLKYHYSRTHGDGHMEPIIEPVDYHMLNTWMKKCFGFTIVSRNAKKYESAMQSTCPELDKMREDISKLVALKATRPPLQQPLPEGATDKLFANVTTVHSNHTAADPPTESRGLFDGLNQFLQGMDDVPVSRGESVLIDDEGEPVSRGERVLIDDEGEPVSRGERVLIDDEAEPFNDFDKPLLEQIEKLKQQTAKEECKLEAYEGELAALGITAFESESMKKKLDDQMQRVYAEMKAAEQTVRNARNFMPCVDLTQSLTSAKMSVSVPLPRIHKLVQYEWFGWHFGSFDNYFALVNNTVGVIMSGESVYVCSTKSVFELDLASGAMTRIVDLESRKRIVKKTMQFAEMCQAYRDFTSPDSCEKVISWDYLRMCMKLDVKDRECLAVVSTNCKDLIKIVVLKNYPGIWLVDVKGVITPILFETV